MADNEDRTPGADRAPSNTTPDAARLTAAIDQFLWPKYLNGADGPARSWQFYQDLKWLGEHVAALLTAESENARLTAALDRVRDDARITLRQIADFCDGEARAPHSAVYTAVRALEDARNLCLSALNDEPMDAARARLSLTCTKAEHIGDGFLHAANDDGPYDVDGIQYCGRCHGLEHPPASSDPTARTQPEGSNG